MIVVSNASPLLALAQAGCLGILKALFDQVSIPVSVYRETVEQCPVPVQRQRIQEAIDDYIAVAAPKRAHSFSRNLGQGEQGVLALALERHAELLLIDDRKARNEAVELGFQCAYTTDVLRLGEQRGIITSLAEVVDVLRNARIYLPFRTSRRTDSN